MTPLPDRRRWLQRAGAALATGLAGCTPQPSTVLSFWAMGREGEVVAQLMPEFERRHPGVRVKVQQLPWTSAHEKLLTAFAGDALPDLAQLGNTWVPEMVALKALEPLDGRVKRSVVVDRADYFTGIWDTNVIAGTSYGVPWYVDTRLLFYRRDLLAQAGFDAPPNTWDEWRAMMRAIAKLRPGQRAIVLPLNEFEPLLALALQQPDTLLRDAGRRGNFSSAGFRRALAFYAEMFDQGWAPLQSETQIGNVWQEVGRGTFVFYISGPWNIQEFKTRLPAAQQSAWMTAPLPGPDGPGASTAGGSSLVMFRHSRQKAAAWQLIEFLSEPAQQLRFRELTGDLPPRRASWAAPALRDDVHARAFREQLERAKPSPAVPEWERIANEMQHVAARSVAQRVPPDVAAREIDARVDGFLEKRRWMLDRAAKAAP
ncbi:sugar ABC transporter substrate-binding protein [Aquabacterium sp.]|uniref:sugar ABC transporter substrate-binding protein n=1 Tax=Aquabacterium sp. TaxID=1872578 RepID=UPI002B6F2035|nr:sugar ABC transporter substrate-binding protein [Aquabacterium sp.]HSW09223.1 sugar ABC transporter substrate-binding protein [Aquabacterium sp.]